MLSRNSKNQHKNHQKSQKEQAKEARRYDLSSQLVDYFSKVIKNGVNSVRIISFEKISQLCAQQLKRITQLKEQNGQLSNQIIDNELTVTVVGIQSKIILEERSQMDYSNSRVSQTDKKREEQDTKHNGIFKRYQNIIGEVQKSQSEIEKFLDREKNETNIDFANCYFFFVTHSRKLKKLQKEKLIASRIKLLQTIAFFLKEAAYKLQPQMAQKIEVERSQQSTIYGANASFLQSPRSDPLQESTNHEEVNSWSRYSSRFLQDKILELSGICQQIPQLQTYKRTLQFAQLQSGQKVSFFKVVDVLISLHHKVSYLARNKPQLLRQLEQAKCQITFMNSKIDQFLSQMMDEANQIYSINFQGLDERWKSQLSQDLIHLRGHLHKLSEIIIRQDQIHTQNYAKVDRLIKIVELFGKVLSGEQEFAQEWDELVNQQQAKGNQTISNEEYRVIMLLQQCLALEQSRIEQIQQNDNTIVNRTNQELEIEVNKLIEDYERLKGDNSQLVNTLQMERRLREELLVEVDQRDKMIKNLSAKKLGLEKKLARQDGQSVASSKIKDGEFRKLQHEVQKYLQSSLLLKEQLKVSQAQRQKLAEQLQADKKQHLKTVQAMNRLKPQKERLEIQCEELQSRIQVQKSQQLRQNSRLNKMVADLTNEKSLLQMQVDTSQRNNIRLMERLEANEKKLAEYNKIIMSRLDEKDDSSLLRLERQLERSKKEAQTFQKSSKQLQSQNKELRDELTNLKYKLKQNELNKESYGQSQQMVLQMKSKVQKLQSKNNNLARYLDQAKNKEQQLEEKLKISAKKIRQLQNKQRDAQSERSRLIKNSQQAERRAQELQRQLDDLRHWNEKEMRTARQMLSKKELQLLEKLTSVSSLEVKIRMLEDQLSKKSSQSEKVTQELIQTKVRQYQTTIQTHKLIQLKLQEKAKGLQKELQQKIQIEFKLSSEIDRLAKQIDRMRAQLEKYIRELTEKQLLIKIERQKIDQQVKQIRQYQIKEKVRQQQMYTPHHDKPTRQDENPSTPSQFQDPLSRSNAKYDNYFNAKEYDRLSKEFSDFKKHASQKLQALQSSLEEALKEKAKLKAQLSLPNSREKESISKNQASKQKSEQLKQELKLQVQKNDFLQEKLNFLTNLNQHSASEIQEMRHKQSQQTQLLENMRRQKKQLSDKLSAQMLEKQKIKLAITRDSEMAVKTKALEDKVKSLLQLNIQLKEAYRKLQVQMDKQTKNIFNHYEAQMKRVIAETNAINSKLASEVDFLKKQLEMQQKPSKVQRQKEQSINELKRSIEQLLSQKNKILIQYTRLQNEKSINDRQKAQHIKEIALLKEKNSSQTLTIKTYQEKAKINTQYDEYQIKINEFKVQTSILLKQRDSLRVQYESLRKNLQEQAKKTAFLESQVNKLTGQLQYSKRINIQLQTHIKTQNQYIKKNGIEQKTKSNEEYLIAKIKALEQALSAVGQELTDCKALKNPSAIAHKNIELQQYWTNKQKAYLQELQSLKRQIRGLKQVIEIGRSERPIVTSLPHEGIPAASTYSEGRAVNKIQLIRVEKILQGKRRWQNIQFSQSLSKWGVPALICQQIEELRHLFLSTGNTIDAINKQQINLQEMIGSLPSLENLIEYVLRILSFFSEVPLNSPQASKIRSQLQSIGQKYTGGYLFTVLQQYTIHILQNNAIQQYKRQLRTKARELLEIKQRLDHLITQQLEHQEHIYSKPNPTANRTLEPGHYRSSSYSSLSSSRNK